MPHFFARLSLILAGSALSLAAFATSAEDDLRLAAKLHKRGETPQAVAIWMQWAGQGNADAAYNLAVIHQHADGVPLDYSKAMQWYRLAAEQGDKISQFQIGLMYQIGQGVAANEEEAHRCFTAHRKHHMHHLQTPQMAAWRDQARTLIDERDRREQLAASRSTSNQVLADLKRRAGMTGERPIETAALAAATTH